jgi:hypothetical protein
MENNFLWELATTAAAATLRILPTKIDGAETPSKDAPCA